MTARDPSLAPLSKLSAAIAGQAAASSPASRIMAALGGRVGLPRPIMIPGLGLEAAMNLLGSTRSIEIDGLVAQSMEARGLEASVLNQGRHELERAVRTLAEVIVERDDATRLVGSLTDWGAVPAEVIGELWRMYSDLREEYDPSVEPLTVQEAAELRAAVSKKNGRMLQFFGARRLSAYLLTLDDPPTSSSTPKSSPGDSSPAS